ncbi:hypothetical protein [Streptomyces sp. 900105755]
MPEPGPGQQTAAGERPTHIPDRTCGSGFFGDLASAGHRVEIGERLVEQQEFGPLAEGQGERDAGASAGREFADAGGYPAAGHGELAVP